MKLALFLAAASVVALSGPAQAQVDAAAPVATAPASEATPVAPLIVTVKPEEARLANARQAATGDPNRRVCRSQGSTGSRIASAKVCKSAREWDEQRLAAKAELDRHQRPDGTNF